MTLALKRKKFCPILSNSIPNRPNEYPLSPYDWTKDYIETFFEETSLSPKIIRKKLMMVYY